MLARSGGLDRRVEREQVRLERNLFDHLDDLADLLGGLVDARHCVIQLAHCAVARIGGLPRLAGQLISLLGILGVGSRHGGHFLKRAGGLFQGRRLLARTRGELLRRHRNLLGRVANLIRALIKAGDDLVNRLDDTPRDDDRQDNAQQNRDAGAAHHK